MMRVPYNYLPMQFADPEAIIKEWRTLIQSTEFTLGSYVEKFEQKFASFTGCKHVISTNTGTDALILALKAIGVGPGDEVISVPLTFYATIGAIVAVGARPVFIDCNDRFQMDPDFIEGAITPRTKAILPVHWGGASPDMIKIMHIAQAHQIDVIEDAAMAPGGDILGKHPGTFGSVNAWSMHPLKPLNVMGDGGMATTDNDALAAWMRMYRNHGMIDRDHNKIWGVNMRLQPLQAVVACHMLETLRENIRIRNHNAKMLDEGFRELSDYVTTPPRIKGYRETFSLYMARFKKRDQLIKYLLSMGIEAKIHYPVPLHLQPAAFDLGYSCGDFPISEQISDEIITLPAHQYISTEQIQYMIKTIKNFYQ
jgi:dTDP-4-amino-4,6-dideoxygalactose transaminase